MTFAIDKNDIEGRDEALLDATILECNLDTWNTSLEHCTTWSESKWKMMQLIPRTFSESIANNSYGAGMVHRTIEDSPPSVEFIPVDFAGIISKAAIFLLLLTLTGIIVIS